jgi:hypothetical protein
LIEIEIYTGVFLNYLFYINVIVNGIVNNIRKGNNDALLSMPFVI